MKRLLMLAMLAALLSCRAKPIVLEVVPTPQMGEPQSVAMAETVPTPQQHFEFSIPPDLSTSETLQYLYVHYPEWEWMPDVVNAGGETRVLFTPYGYLPLAIRGDVNDDQQYNLVDVLEMVDILLGRREATYYESRAGDCDGNRKLDILDVLNLVDKILGRT